MQYSADIAIDSNRIIIYGVNIVVADYDKWRGRDEWKDACLEAIGFAYVYWWGKWVDHADDVLFIEDGSRDIEFDGDIGWRGGVWSMLIMR